MTATIRPNTAGVSRADVSDRLADYKKCIRFYIDQTRLPIYFLENSDYDLSQDADFKDFESTGRFHLLRIEPHPDSSKGKGFQEFYMLDGFVKNQLEVDMLIKVTGRYIVKNIAGLIPQLTAPLNIDIHRKLKVAITGFFAIDKSVYLAYFYEKYTLAQNSNSVFRSNISFLILYSES